MTTQIKAVTTTTARSSVASGLSASADSTKEFTDGCNKCVIVDARLCGANVTATLSTRASPDSERTTDPAAYSPVTVAKGTVRYLGPYKNTLYGQNATENDLKVDLAVGGSLSTPTGLATTPYTSGGSLANATYYYRVSAVNCADGETLACAEVTGVVSGGGGAGRVALEWDAVAGAVAYNIYGRATSGALKLLKVICDPRAYWNATKVTWIDTGAIAESAIAPPGANTATDALNMIYTDAVTPTQAS